MALIDDILAAAVPAKEEGTDSQKLIDLIDTVVAKMSAANRTSLMWESGKDSFSLERLLNGSVRVDVGSDYVICIPGDEINIRIGTMGTDKMGTLQLVIEGLQTLTA